MLGEHGAVIGSEDDKSIVPQIKLLQFVENLAASDSGYTDDDLQRFSLIEGAIRAVEAVIAEQRAGRAR